MHVAKIPNRNSTPTYLLRETYREDGKVKHRTVGNITKLPIEKIVLIDEVLKNHELVPIDKVIEIVDSKPHGHVAAILDAIKELRLDTLIDSKPSRNRNLVLAMIVQRIIAPRSKLGTTSAWHSTTLAEELKVQQCDADDLYDAMDWLLKRQSKIERKLAKRHITEGDTVLYDISSSYFEDEHCPLAKFGYNRDKKSGKKIVVYGLLTNSLGIPVSIQAYPGNTSDSTTVADQADKLRNDFKLQEIVLVGDRGMITGTQIKILQQYPGIKHISALRSESIIKLIEKGQIARSLFDETHLAEIQSDDFPGERLIVCFNPFLQKRREQSREELLVSTEKLLQDLKESLDKKKNRGLIEEDAKIGIRIGKISNKYNVSKHFFIDVHGGVFAFRRNEESIRRESEQDGLYVIRTNVKSSQRKADDVVRDYKRLADVEKSFRTIKTTLLDVRPIHHRLEDRVRSHIFLCMLAYYVVVHLHDVWSEFLYVEDDLSAGRSKRHPVLPAEPSEQTKAKKLRCQTVSEEGSQERPENFRTLLDHLSTQCRNTCQITSRLGEAEFERLTTPTPYQDELFQCVKRLGDQADAPTKK